MKKPYTSLAVLVSLLPKLNDSPNRDSLIHEITSLLLRDGVVSPSEVKDRTDSFNNMVSEIEMEMSSGVSWGDAYKKVVSKYSEFANINLN